MHLKRNQYHLLGWTGQNQDYMIAAITDVGRLETNLCSE
jgi:hypothetical protein